MSQAHRDLIQRFYDAFSRRDAEAMAACYHHDITFSDPVFVSLKGEQAGDMWRMLTSRGSDLRIEVSNITAEGVTGGAHWDAHYSFSATGRKVLNRIDASFRFADGLIIEHVDHFDLWRWAAQALGPVGLLLGWSPPVQNKIRAQASEALRRFSAERRPL